MHEPLDAGRASDDRDRHGGRYWCRPSGWGRVTGRQSRDRAADRIGLGLGGDARDRGRVGRDPRLCADRSDAARGRARGICPRVGLRQRVGPGRDERGWPEGPRSSLRRRGRAQALPFLHCRRRFGSKDFDGQQVDDGTYTLEGDEGIVINGMRFRYKIDGDELSLEPEPVDISACTTKECRFGAAWVLMVAMPGMSWTRAEISEPGQPSAP